MTDNNSHTATNSSFPPRDWIETTLGEVAEIVGGTTPSTKDDTFWNGNIPWITPKDLSGNTSVYIKNGERNVTEIALKNTGIKLLPENSVLFSSRAPIGYIAINKIPVTTNQGFKSLIPNEKSNFKFLYYWLKQNSGNIEKQASGSTFMEVSGAVVKQIKILLPPLPEQQAIASVLSAFDDKIELNNKINKNLEEIAQTIFKEWFNENSKLWKKKNVMELVKRIPVGKKYDNKTALPNGKVPILDQGQSGYIGFHNNEPGVMARIDEPVVVFTNHTCNYRLMTRPFSVIQNVLPYVGINGYPTLFVYYLTRGKITMQEYKGHWPEFEQQEFFVPLPELAREFTVFIKPMVQKMVEVEDENQKLSALRDLLLPKLMSGEIKV
jgi:type I restriction enzyme, S subunit